MTERPEGEQPEIDPFEAIVAGLGASAPQRDLALIVTPFASAEALAGLAAAAGLACTVVPSESGAVAAMDLEVADPFEKLTGEPPKEALALAKAISILTRIDVVLLVSRLVSEGGEVSLEGELSAWRVTGADIGGEISPGLVIAGLDPTIEDLAVGEKRLADVPGTIDSSALSSAEAAGMISRAVQRPGRKKRHGAARDSGVEPEADAAAETDPGSEADPAPEHPEQDGTEPEQ
nr:hypothetical protein [Actinomycetales bacterium]